MIDLPLLRIAKYRAEYNRLKYSVPLHELDPKTRLLFKAYGKYYDKFPAHDKINLSILVARLRSWYPRIDKESFAAFKKIIGLSATDLDETAQISIVQDMLEIDAAGQIAEVLQKFKEGDLDDSVLRRIETILTSYKDNTVSHEVDWDQTDIDELLLEDLNDEGLRWRLDALREHMRPLRPGDFGIIAGRPDRGKTTFLASEVTYMAPQMEPDKNILWLNNEGMSGRIKKRIYQASLGVTIDEMIELRGGEVHKQYNKNVGRWDKIRVCNIHGKSVAQVEQIIENSNPGIILFDMIDKIKGFEGSTRTDERLEEMYDWGRNICVQYECIGLATSQISSDGEGKQYPSMDMLKDSKTGKQGACDFIVMIGASNAQTLSSSRFISIPKNKLARPDRTSNPNIEVGFNAKCARFHNITEEILEEE